MNISPFNRLLLLALFLAFMWFGGERTGVLLGEKGALWDRVREGHTALWSEQMRRGIELSPVEDKLNTGLIGVEWSPLTTTLGDIKAKRTATNPLWAIQFGEWFDALGLKSGDRVVIYSSASFPGLLLSALAAVEARGLHPFLCVSLGSSTWGANRPDFSWPLMAKTLRRANIIHTPTARYTLGGDEERGIGLSNETIELFTRLAKQEGVPLLVADNGQEMIDKKTRLMLQFKPKLLINIGGGYASMGVKEDVLSLPPGLLLPSKEIASKAGDGVMAHALQARIPVIHLLNLPLLAREVGIPWDPDVFVKVSSSQRSFLSALGVVIFVLVLLLNKRWEWGRD